MAILRERPNGRTSHVKGLLAGRRGYGSPEFEFDVLNATEYDRIFMDFRPATMPVDQIGAGGVFQYEEDNAGSTDFVKLAPTAARNSHIKGVISADNPSNIALVAVPQWLSEQNPFLEVAFDVELATNLELSIGFVDVLPGSAADILGDIDTPTLDAGIGEAAILGLDTAQTLTTLALVCENGGTVTAVTASPTAAPIGVPSAATQVVYRVELRGTKAFGFVNGALVAESSASGGPAEGTLLGAVILFGARSAATKDVHIDYIDVGQERVDQPF